VQKDVQKGELLHAQTDGLVLLKELEKDVQVNLKHYLLNHQSLEFKNQLLLRRLRSSVH